MQPEKQIEWVRNVLTSAMIHDAQDRQPTIFRDRLESYHAIFSTGFLYWLFGDEPPGGSQCKKHETGDFEGFVKILHKRLKDAGHSDPASSDSYLFIKACMKKHPEMGLFGALTAIRQVADMTRSTPQKRTGGTD